MGTAACGGKGFNGTAAVSCERPIGAGSYRQQHNEVSCQPPRLLPAASRRRQLQTRTTSPRRHAKTPRPGRGEGRLGQGGRGRSQGGERPMGTTAYGGKGSKGRAANGDRPAGAASCRREQHTMASCQNPPACPTAPGKDLICATNRQMSSNLSGLCPSTPLPLLAQSTGGSKVVMCPSWASDPTGGHARAQDLPLERVSTLLAWDVRQDAPG